MPSGVEAHSVLILLLVTSSLIMIVAGFRGVRWFLRLTFGPFWSVLERRVQQILLWLAGILITYYVGRSLL